MSNITQNLLSRYYGFDKNSDEQISKFLSSHESIDDSVKTFTEASTAESIAADQKLNEDTENKSTPDRKNDSKLNEGKSLDDTSLRSSRVLDEKAFLNDNNTENNYEKFLATSSLGNDYNFGEIEVSRVEKHLPDCKTTADDKTIQDSEETHIDPNVTLIQDVLPDSASDISSAPMKNKFHGKLKTPVVPLPPIPKKGPSCNGIYLDCANIGIEEFPIHMIKSYPGLRMLYLENNKLTKLPDELFVILKNITWLDVRNNLLTSLPESIKYHPSLETILMQGNKIERLPLELCLLQNLKELKVAGNPLNYPPKDIVNLGCQAIQDFLRSEWNILYPEEAIDKPSNQEIKAKSSTILCYQSKTSRKKITNNTSTMLKYTIFKSSHPKKKSVREKSWRYKPSNRYGIAVSNKLKPLKKNESLDNEQLTMRLSNSCSRATFQNTKLCPLRDIKNENETIKESFLESISWTCTSAESIEMPDSGILRLLGPSPRSHYVRNNVVLVDCDCEKAKPCKIRLEKIDPRNLRRVKIDALATAKETELKERIFHVITNDRVMMKLFPMRMEDPQWMLSFLETYIDLQKRRER